MTTIYKGYKLEVNREQCMAGYSMLFFNITREKDGYECLSSFEDSAEKIRDKINELKERVDNELKEEDPWMEKEGLW
jgi:hypothetical protein